MLFRPIYPPHRLLHQQDNHSATLQLVGVRNVSIPRFPIRSLLHVYNCEGFEEAKELPDETGERRGLFKLEFLEDHVRTLNVHPKLAPSTGLVAIGINLYVVKDGLYIQHWRLVVGDPMDAFVEEDEKQGLEFIGNLVCLVGIYESLGRDEWPCALENHHRLQRVRKRKTEVKGSPYA